MARKKEPEFYQSLLVDAKKFTFLRGVNIGRLAVAVLKHEKISPKTVVGKRLMELVENLEGTERRVIVMVFGLSEEFPAPMTLQRVGESLSVSRQRVAVIKNTALQKLYPSPLLEEELFYLPAREKRKLHLYEVSKKRQQLLKQANARGLTICEADWEPISNLKLSPRAHNALDRAGAKTIIDFKLLDLSQVAKTRGIGVALIEEIKEKRKELGVPFN